MAFSIYSPAPEPADVNIERVTSRALAMFGAELLFRGPALGHVPAGLNDRQLRDIGLVRDMTDETAPATLPSWRIEL